MVSVALLLAFFGMLRVSEYTSPSAVSWDHARTLSCTDVRVDSSIGVVFVGVKVSKTDPFGCGAVVRVSVQGNVLKKNEKTE